MPFSQDSIMNSTQNYDELFAGRTSKTISGLLSTLLTWTGSPLQCGIIWFERFGSHHHRTLVNKLTSKIFQMGMISTVLVYFTEMFRFFVGQSPPFASQRKFSRVILLIFQPTLCPCFRNSHSILDLNVAL